MTEIEYKQFIERSFAAFPGLHEWVESKSPEPSETLGFWARSLKSVSIEDANKVLDGWCDGSITDPPVGFRREMFALDVRAISQRWRDDRRKQQQHVEIDSHDRSHRRRSVALSPYIARLIDVGDMFKRGDISERECDDRMERIVFEGCQAIDGKSVA